MRMQGIVRKRRERRKFHVRNTCRSTGRARLSVFRSNNHMYAQVIDDASGRTLAAASTMEKDLGGAGSYQGNKGSAARVGKAVAERAIKAGVKEVSFDRGSYRYHGRVAALADAARQAGLDF